MADKDTQNTFVTTIALALGLPVGSSESDTVAAAQRLRSLEAQGTEICGVQSSAELLGSVRALKSKADLFDAQASELATVKGERDKQNFDTLVAQGRSAGQLVPAHVKLYEERFSAASEKGNGADVVAELRGFLAVQPRVVAQKLEQPSMGSLPQAQLTWNGKTYADLTYSQRADLAKADPDLWAHMKRDWEDTKAA